VKKAGALLEHVSTKLHGVTHQKYVILMLVATGQEFDVSVELPQIMKLSQLGQSTRHGLAGSARNTTRYEIMPGLDSSQGRQLLP
jgi:hypothetical protein